MSTKNVVPRTILLALLLAVVSCSGQKDRKKLEGQELINSFEGEHKHLAADIAFLGDAYCFYFGEKQKSPADWKELEPHARETDRPDDLKRHVRDDISFVWNVDLTSREGSKNYVLVYERNADKDGNRLVVTGDSKLRLMGEEEFQTALKATKKK